MEEDIEILQAEEPIEGVVWGFRRFIRFRVVRDGVQYLSPKFDRPDDLDLAAHKKLNEETLKWYESIGKPAPTNNAVDHSKKRKFDFD